jgi:hypothetical protein
MFDLVMAGRRSLPAIEIDGVILVYCLTAIFDPQSISRVGMTSGSAKHNRYTMPPMCQLSHELLCCAGVKVRQPTITIPRHLQSLVLKRPSAL